MRTTIKLGLTALMAAILLASALSTTSARNLELFNSVNWRVTWSRLEFQSSLAILLRCQVTLEGSFHSRTIPKVARLLMGAITRIDIKENCTSGSARPERPPPWHLTYEGFTGRLPTIETVRLLIQRFQFAIIVMGVTCKYGTPTDNVTVDARVNLTSEITSITPTRSRNIVSLLEGSLICPATGTLVSGTGDGSVTLLNTTTRIRVTLI